MASGVLWGCGAVAYTALEDAGLAGPMAFAVLLFAAILLLRGLAWVSRRRGELCPPARRP